MTNRKRPSMATALELRAAADDAARGRAIEADAVARADRILAREVAVGTSRQSLAAILGISRQGVERRAATVGQRGPRTGPTMADRGLANLVPAPGSDQAPGPEGRGGVRGPVPPVT